MGKLNERLDVFSSNDFISHQNHIKIDGIDNTPALYNIHIEDERYVVECDTILSSSWENDVTITSVLFIEDYGRGDEEVAFYKVYGTNNNLDESTLNFIPREFKHIQEVVYNLLYGIKYEELELLADRFQSVMADNGMTKEY